jgi:hypothetical protein
MRSACTSGLRYTGVAPGDLVTTVPNLTVTGLTTTGQLAAGTGTFYGRGTPDSGSEAALYVATNARIDGLSTHGSTHVTGTSCLDGAVTAPLMYGPVTVSADPAASLVSGTLLNVVGGAAATTLTSDAVTADTVEVVTDLAVDGYDSSSQAAANVFAAYQSAFVTIVINTGSNNVTTQGTYVTYGGTTYIVGVALIPTAATSTSSEYTVIAGTTTGKAYLGNGALVSLIAQWVSPTYNLVFYRPTGSTTPYVPLRVPALAWEEDTPVPGSPVLVVGPGATGLGRYITGTIVNPVLSVFGQYVSHELAIGTIALDNSYSGAPILNYRGSVIGFLQSGAPYKTTAFLRATPTAIKARYAAALALVNTLSSVPAAGNINAPVSSSVAVSRGIKPVERATASLPTNGVSTVIDSTTSGSATTLINLSGGPVTNTKLVTALLGSELPNLPSFYDVYVGGLLTYPDIAYSDWTWNRTAANSSTTNVAYAAADVLSASYWDNGAPGPLPTQLSSAWLIGTTERSTNTNLVSNVAGQFYYDQQYQIVLPSTAPLALDEFVAMSTGSVSSVSNGTVALYVVVGGVAGVDGFLSNLGGSQSAGAAWKAYRSSILPTANNITVVMTWNNTSSTWTIAAQTTTALTIFGTLSIVLGNSSASAYTIAVTATSTVPQPTVASPAQFQQALFQTTAFITNYVYVPSTPPKYKAYVTNTTATAATVTVIAATSTTVSNSTSASTSVY